MAPPDRVIGVGKRVEPTSTSSSALPWHGRGQGFDSPQVHQRDSVNALRGRFSSGGASVGMTERRAYVALLRSAHFPEMEVGAGSKKLRPTRRIERRDPGPTSMDPQGATIEGVFR